MRAYPFTVYACACNQRRGAFSFIVQRPIGMADVVGFKEVEPCSGFAGGYSTAAIGIHCAPFGYEECYALVKCCLCFIAE